jgi:hypothetical protein
VISASKIFSFNGNGQVAKDVNAQGGLYALLKSMITSLESGGKSTYKNLPEPYVVMPEVLSEKTINSLSPL